MYTISQLETSLYRLQLLRQRLKQPDVRYNHELWFHPCGSPSCALGYGSTISELQTMFAPGFYDEDGLYCDDDCFYETGREVFCSSSEVYASYLFLYRTYYSSNRTYYSSSSSTRCYILLRERGDNSLETTLQRLDRVINYFRRKLAILYAEEESREIKLIRRRIRNAGIKLCLV